ncbi:recombination mediator RecR [Rurimicrobium arvi]|uniref:Recombination protein RecR n=1 Tax=Rurimicrobium arvi TaxID=2049916 RepID=A0ABP8MMS6_9BACT
MIFSSRLIEDAVAEFSKLPGIGKKSALRMVLHLLRQETADVDAFTEAISRLIHQITYCRQCHNVSDTEICSICVNTQRNPRQICVVETIRDVMAIEQTQQYNGHYHVLGGILSPLDGVGPEHLNIGSLLERVTKQGDTEEIIMALSPTLEGDTTVYYISRQLKHLPLKITTIARGIAFGGELEYADEMTLARSISKRLPVDNYVNVGPASGPSSDS